MFTTAAAAGSPEAALKRVLGVDEKELSAGWHQAIRAAYAGVLSEATAPAALGDAIFTGDGPGNDLNVGPSLSPDGTLIAFLSQRSLLSIDLYVAETATGAIVKRLTSTVASPHFSSLQFSGRRDRAGDDRGDWADWYHVSESRAVDRHQDRHGRLLGVRQGSARHSDPRSDRAWQPSRRGIGSACRVARVGVGQVVSRRVVANLSLSATSRGSRRRAGPRAGRDGAALSQRARR